VEPGSAAAQAGLKVGDRIAAFDGHPVGNFTELQRLIEPAANRSVELQVQRKGTTLQVPITVREKEVGGKKVGRIGIAPVTTALLSSVTAENMMTLQKYSLAPALGHAARKTWDTSILSLRIMGRIVTGDVSVKNISGPISIAGSMGFAARQDWHVFFGMLALISISLGLINLMPIPILDGGQIVYQLAELVKGRPVSERTLLIGQQIGVAMVVLLMGLAFYNDIARYLHP
jgi:regulator of sigma E protease